MHDTNQHELDTPTETQPAAWWAGPRITVAPILALLAVLSLALLAGVYLGYLLVEQLLDSVLRFHP